MARNQRSGGGTFSLSNAHRQPVPRTLALAVALAIAAPSGFAACGSAGTTVISGNAGPCELVAGSTLKVTRTGTLGSSTGAAATADHVTGRLQILNAGTLAGAPGISLTNSTLTGGVINYASGTLAGSPAGSSAVLVSHVRLSQGVTNNGSILANLDNAINGSGLWVENSISGGLRNRGQLSGAVYGLLALDTTLNGNVNNSGTVAGAVTGVALNNSIVHGDVLNSGGIDGGQYGLALTGTRVQGSVRSSGTLHGGADALRIVNSHISGTVLTQGRITSADQGIQVLGGRLAGDLVNEATLTARVGLVANSNLRGNLINRGHIAAASSGLALYNTTLKGTVQNTGSIMLEGGTVQGEDVPQAALGVHFNSAIGGIYNSGSITSSDRTAVQVDTATVGRKGIKNAGGTLSGRTGLFIDNARVSGAVINTGTLHGSGDVGPAAGVRIRASQLGGGLINAGTISSAVAAISVDNSGLVGNLRNSGTLAGGNGLRLEDSNLDGSLINSGTIRAEVFGIALLGSDLSGDLVNTGTLFGTDNGLRLSGSRVLGAIFNTGTLGAHTSAMQVFNSYVKGGIVNTGRIEAPAGVSLGNSRVASVDNQGVIQGGDDGVLTLAGSQLSGDLANSGSLLAQATSPFTLLLVDSQVGGRVINSGTIAGQNGITVRNSSVTGGIDISGRVLADAVSGYAVDIDSASSVPQLRISGNNSARFSGAVRTTATPVVITPGSAYTLQDGNRFEVPTFENRGTLAVAAQGPDPDDPGALAHAAVATIQGNYLQASGATFSPQVVNATQYGHLVVTGTATLPSQAKLYVDVANPAQPFNVSGLNNVISAGTLASDGTYTVASNSQLFTFSGVKDANTLDLTLAAKSNTAVSDALQGNARSKPGLGAARVLDSQVAQGASSALGTRFVSATSAAQVAQAVAQSLPLTNALPASQFVLEQMTDSLRERLAETPLAAAGYAQPPGGVWIKPFGARMADNQRSASNGFAASAGGTLLGAEAALSKSTRVGVAFAYGTGQAVDQGTAPGRNNQLELYQFTAYGSHLLDEATELSVHAGMGHNDSEGRRTLSFDGGNSQASARVGSQVLTTGVALSRRLPVSDATTLTPALTVDYTRVHDNAYQERGAASIAPLLLNIDARTIEQLLLGFEARASHAISPGMQVKGKLGAAYDLLDEGNRVTAAFAGAPGQRFTTPGSELGPWVLRAGLEFNAVSRGGTRLSFGMDLQSRAGYTEHSRQIRLSVPF